MVLQPRLALKDRLDFEILGRLNGGAAPEIARAQLAQYIKQRFATSRV